MSKKIKRKLKIKNIVLLFIFLCILSASIYFTIDYLNPYKEKAFEELGYNSSEIEFILNLEDSEKDKLLATSRIHNIIKHYTIEHYTDLINLDYSDEEIDNLLKLDKDTLSYVLNHERIDDLFIWLSYDNFILSNFDRYIDHSSNKPLIKHELIIEQVNTNRDHAYYTAINKSNIELGNLVLVNKYFALDKDYAPKNLISIAPYGNVKLVDIAAEAFKELCRTAENDGYTIIGISGYRSYQTQYNLYNRYLQKDPQWLVDTYSARAGHSEHQTGLAIDVSSNNSDILTFESSSSFKWMKTNAHRFGYILRYQKGKEDITGYKYEPWHYRYVGEEIASMLYETGMTYDEYVALYLSN
jgi:LAS superfamily LD-carboxypeptidase LdcB